MRRGFIARGSKLRRVVMFVLPEITFAAAASLLCPVLWEMELGTRQEQ